VTESYHHKIWKGVACGCGDNVALESRLPDSKRLDCRNEDTGVCAEVELSRTRIPYDIAKLSKARSIGLCPLPKLVVRKKDLDYAKSLAAKTKIDVIPATKQNLSSAMSSCFISARRKSQLL
jgi:hypothetical protein